MRRTQIILLVGAGIVAVGVFLSLWAGALATTWQSEGPGVWGGMTDPAMRRTYQQLGLIVLCSGLVMVTMAAWNWMNDGREVSIH